MSLGHKSLFTLSSKTSVKAQNNYVLQSPVKSGEVFANYTYPELFMHTPDIRGIHLLECANPRFFRDELYSEQVLYAIFIGHVLALHSQQKWTSRNCQVCRRFVGCNVKIF
jgi:hypothetical protein